MKKIMFLSLITLVSCFSAFAEKKPPQAVLNSFNQKFTGITDVDWSLEKNGEWEAEFDAADGKETSANFSLDGTWLETETEIAITDLPSAVRDAVTKMRPGKKIKEAARILDASGQITYEVEVSGKDLIFNAEGDFVR